MLSTLMTLNFDLAILLHCRPIRCVHKTAPKHFAKTSTICTRSHKILHTQTTSTLYTTV